MSVDFYAQVTTPVGVADLLTTAGSVMAELIGLDDPDALAVVVGRVRLAGRLVGGGEVLTDRRLAAERIGPGAPNRSLDVVDAAGEELAAMLVSETSADCLLVVSPRPTARAIVTGLSVALAAALLGEGRVDDNDLRLVDGYETDVAGFVAATRLPHATVLSPPLRSPSSVSSRVRGSGRPPDERAAIVAARAESISAGGRLPSLPIWAAAGEQAGGAEPRRRSRCVAAVRDAPRPGAAARGGPRSGGPAGVMALQRLAGNAAVAGVLGRAGSAPEPAPAAPVPATSPDLALHAATGGGRPREARQAAATAAGADRSHRAHSPPACPASPPS